MLQFKYYNLLKLLIINILKKINNYYKIIHNKYENNKFKKIQS